jgi:hypothetical protein
MMGWPLSSRIGTPPFVHGTASMSDASIADVPVLPGPVHAEVESAVSAAAGGAPSSKAPTNA